MTTHALQQGPILSCIAGRKLSVGCTLLQTSHPPSGHISTSSTSLIPMRLQASISSLSPSCTFSRNREGEALNTVLSRPTQGGHDAPAQPGQPSGAWRGGTQQQPAPALGRPQLPALPAARSRPPGAAHAASRSAVSAVPGPPSPWMIPPPGKHSTFF